MPLFRCTSRPCGRFEYEAPAAIPCPQCGNVASVLLVTVHYDPVHPRNPKRRQGVPACQPSRSTDGLASTGEPIAVTCPQCRLLLPESQE